MISKFLLMSAKIIITDPILFRAIVTFSAV